MCFNFFLAFVQAAGFALWGFGGVVQSECPQLRCTLVDFSNDIVPPEELRTFALIVQTGILPADPLSEAAEAERVVLARSKELLISVSPSSTSVDPTTFLSYLACFVES